MASHGKSQTLVLLYYKTMISRFFYHVDVYTETMERKYKMQIIIAEKCEHVPLNLSKRASLLKGTKSSLTTFEFVRLSETLFHLVMDRNWSLQRNLIVFIFVKEIHMKLRK